MNTWHSKAYTWAWCISSASWTSLMPLRQSHGNHGAIRIDDVTSLHCHLLFLGNSCMKASTFFNDDRFACLFVVEQTPFKPLCLLGQSPGLVYCTPRFMEASRLPVDWRGTPIVTARPLLHRHRTHCGIHRKWLVEFCIKRER